MNPPTYPFPLPPLRFAYDALEPHIDAQTMELHHRKHHQTYLDNLNKALEAHPDLHGLSIEAILARFDSLPEGLKPVVRSHGGGHANHQFFWKVIGPAEGANQPDGPKSGELREALTKDFGSFVVFKEAFTKAALGVFGSGWAFLVIDPATKKLEILALPNQDSVLFHRKPGLLCCDVWEHAYYLKRQNRRAEYLEAWWNVVAWDVVNSRLVNFRAGKQQL